MTTITHLRKGFSLAVAKDREVHEVVGAAVLSAGLGGGFRFFGQHRPW